MAATVQNCDNLFFGQTEAQVLAAQDKRIKSIMEQAGSVVSSASVNGSSTSFSKERRDVGTAQNWALHIAAALYELDPVKYPRPTTNKNRALR